MKNLKKVLIIVALLFTSVLSFWYPLKKVNAAGGSQGETWVMNEELDLMFQGDLISFSVWFTSNNVEYEKLDATYFEYFDKYSLHYYDYTSYPVYQKTVYDSTQGWFDEAYRTITFEEAPTGDLLTWLESNAVKVVEEIPVESIEIEHSSGKLFVGGTYQIVPIVSPPNATDEVIYYSDNEAVATVDEDGLVTAVGEGTATITASAGDKSDTILIKVVRDTYLGGYNDGYDEGYDDGYDEGYDDGYIYAYEWVLAQVYEYGISSIPKSGNTYYDNTESFDYRSGYGQAWGLGYDLGYLEGSGMPLTPEEKDIVYNWGYEAGYKAGQEDQVGFFGTLFGSIGQFLSIEILPNITLGIILSVPLIFGIISFLIGRGK